MRLAQLGQYAAISIASSLTACGAPQPTPAQLAEMRGVPRPSSQEAAEKAVVKYFAGTLKDPDSARYTFLQSANGWQGTHFGWFMCGTVNSKNSYGGYVGSQVFMAYFSPSMPDRVVDGAIDSSSYAIVAGWCRRIYGS